MTTYEAEFHAWIQKSEARRAMKREICSRVVSRNAGDVLVRNAATDDGVLTA